MKITPRKINLAEAKPLSSDLLDIADQCRELDDNIRAGLDLVADDLYEQGQLLIEAKEECKHGQWKQFCDQAEISPRVAQVRMQVAGELTKDEFKNFENWSTALKAIQNPKATPETHLTEVDDEWPEAQEQPDRISYPSPNTALKADLSGITPAKGPQGPQGDSIQPLDEKPQLWQDLVDVVMSHPDKVQAAVGIQLIARLRSNA